MRNHFSLRIILASAAVLGAISLAQALEHPPKPVPGPAPAARLQDNLFEQPNHPLNPDEADDARFHDSGTRGRDSLGADPEHPEGPGGTTADVN